MLDRLDSKRIGIFLAFAFGIAWLTGGVIYLTGGLINSPSLAPGVSLAVVLMAAPYMWAPALANILTRMITHEGWQNTGLRPNFRRGWLLWVAAWLLPGLLTILGGVLFFLVLPQYYDSGLTKVNALLAQSGQAGMIDPWLTVVAETLGGILIAPLVNSLFTFGEEFGWRAYLLPKLMPLGTRRALIVLGLIWGVWHWPVIFMGYEYGFDYPGAPWAGPLVFLFFTVALGIFLAWVTLRGGSIWPAVIGHAAINGIAGLMALLSQGDPNPLIGPLPVGVLGGMGYILFAVWLFFNPHALAPTGFLQPQAAQEDSTGG